MIYIGLHNIVWVLQQYLCLYKGGAKYPVAAQSIRLMSQHYQLVLNAQRLPGEPVVFIPYSKAIETESQCQHRMVAAATVVKTAATGWLNFSVRLKGKQEKEQIFSALNSYLKHHQKVLYIFRTIHSNSAKISKKSPHRYAQRIGDQVDSHIIKINHHNHSHQLLWSCLMCKSVKTTRRPCWTLRSLKLVQAYLAIVFSEWSKISLFSQSYELVHGTTLDHISQGKDWKCVLTKEKIFIWVYVFAFSSHRNIIQFWQNILSDMELYRK